MRAAIEEAKQMVADLAAQADQFENKHLRDVLHDAVGRLHDAANHPDAEPAEQQAPQGVQTGEPNPMFLGTQS